MHRERWPIARRAAAATFVVLVLVIPVGLLTSVRPAVLATVIGTMGIVLCLGQFIALPKIRRTARVGAQGFVIAAAILGILHVTHLLEPMYRREGWLFLDLEVAVSPLRVQPGETLTFTLSSTNGGPRAARGRSFIVDGTACEGVLIYGRLPDLKGSHYLLNAAPTAALVSSLSNGRRTCRVVYANPGLPELNPMTWEWSTTYTPGWKIVAAITGDGETGGDLDVGETLRLTFDAVVPLDQPGGRLYLEHAAISYRDPQWATYYVHDRRFRFEEPVMVVAPSD